VTGDVQVGKSSLVQTLLKGAWTDGVRAPTDDYESYYKDDAISASLMIDGKERAMSIIDTGHYYSGGRMDMSETYIPEKFVEANGLLVCFNLGNDYSWHWATHRWVPLALESAEGKGVPVFLVGLQSDLRGSVKATPSKDDCEKQANELGVTAYFECSAKNNEGVSDVFEAVISELDAFAAANKGAVPMVSKAEGGRSRRRRGLFDDDDATEVPKAKKLPKTPKKSKKSAPAPAPVVMKTSTPIEPAEGQQLQQVEVTDVDVAGAASKNGKKKGDCTIL